MEDYKPNSNRFKQEQKEKQQAAEKKVEKVVTGPVTTRKKSAISKFAEEFIAEDAKNIKSYVVGDVLIPALKKALYDIVTEGFDMLLYGGSRGGNRRSTAERVSYKSYYDRNGRSSVDTRTVSNSRCSYDDIIVATRGEAEEVLDRLTEIVDTYGIARVTDLKDLVGITGEYTDCKYGWTSMRNAEVVRVRDGYLIKMPRASVID